MTDNKTVLCIPRVFSNITEKQIRTIFQSLNLGRIEKIDVVRKKTEIVRKNTIQGDNYNRVFIHLIWNNTEEAAKCRERLTNGNDIKVIYDQPWFWKVSAYREPIAKTKIKTKEVKEVK